MLNPGLVDGIPSLRENAQDEEETGGVGIFLCLLCWICSLDHWVWSSGPGTVCLSAIHQCVVGS